MKYVIVVPLLLLMVTVQSEIISLLRPVGIGINILLPFLVSWAVIRGTSDALWTTALAGILLGLSSPSPLGLTMLALLPIIPLAALRELRLLELNVVLAIPILIVETLLYFAIMLMGLSATGDSLSLTFALRREVLPTLFGSLLVFPLVYWLTATFGRPPQAASPIWGNTWGIRS